MSSVHTAAHARQWTTAAHSVGPHSASHFQQASKLTSHGAVLGRVMLRPWHWVSCWHVTITQVQLQLWVTSIAARLQGNPAGKCSYKAKEEIRNGVCILRVINQQVPPCLAPYEQPCDCDNWRLLTNCQTSAVLHETVTIRTKHWAEMLNSFRSQRRERQNTCCAPTLSQCLLKCACEIRRQVLTQDMEEKRGAITA